MNLLKQILLEFVQQDLGLEEESDAAKQAKSQGLQHISGGYWSKDGTEPASHTTRGGKFRELTPDEREARANKKTKQSLEPEDPEDFERFKKQHFGEPESEPKPEPEQDPDADSSGDSIEKQTKLLSADTEQVLAFAFGTKKSLSKQKKERTEYGKQGIEKLKKLYNTSNWYSTAKSKGEQLKMVGPNGTEEVKLSGEWADLYATMWKTENIGQGTDQSRAGEAAIVHGINQIIDKYKQGPENFAFSTEMGTLREELLSTAKEKGSLLDASWAETALKTTESIINDYGIENIEFVTWDTREGNEAVGSTGHGTSSDMFIKLSDGTTVGVSLKKDFDVFILNGGLATVLEGILEELPSEVSKEIQGKVNIEDYYKRREDAFVELSKVKGFKKEAFRMKDECLNGESCPWKEGSSTYRRLVDGKLDSAFDKIESDQTPNLTSDEMKILARVADKSNIEGTQKKIQKIRNIANDTLEDIFNIAVNNEQFGGLLKEKVVEGLHLPDTLGANLTGIDQFVSYFGPERFDRRDLLKYFVTDPADVKSLQQAIEVRDEATINKFFIDRISLTLDEKTGKAEINFRRTDEKIEGEPEFLSIAFANIRERGIGASPIFELGVSTEFKYILKYGPKLSDWSTRARNIFLKSRGQLEDDIDVGGWDDPTFNQAKDLVRRLTVRELEKYYDG